MKSIRTGAALALCAIVGASGLLAQETHDFRMNLATWPTSQGPNLPGGCGLGQKWQLTTSSPAVPTDWVCGYFHDWSQIVGSSGVAPSGTGYVHVTGGVLDTPNSVIPSANLPTSALTGIIKYASGVPSAVSSGAPTTDCVHPDGSASSGCGGGAGTTYSADGTTLNLTGTTFSANTAVMLSRATAVQAADTTIALTSASTTAFVGAPIGNAAPALGEGMRVLVESNANCAAGLSLDIGNGQGARNVYQLDGVSNPNPSQCASGQPFWAVYATALNSGAGGYRIISGGNGFSGTATMGTTALGAGLCATVVTVSAPGVKATDTVTASANASIKALAGYTPGGGITINAYATADNVNFDQCNALTSTSPTLGAVTLNWRVDR